MPPAMRKALRRDAERAQQILPEQAEEEQDAGRDADRAERHRAAVRRRRARGEAGEDRRAAGRIDHHQEGDEGRDEQLDHRPSGGGEAGAGIGRDQGVAQQHGDRHRPDAAGHRRDRAGDLAGAGEIDVADQSCPRSG